ncbi:ribonucleoside-diphosphate reductase, alpha subunit [Anncaliia algerae PRA109]|nr:ribonucleoside-diphosphate reductase, alpha subunit [Anncaliia algerae PRA109]
MFIIKRNNEPRPFDRSKLLKSIQAHTCGLDTKNINPNEFVDKIMLGIVNNMTTTELCEYSAETAASCMSLHPDFGVLASRILVSSLHKSTSNSFSEKIILLYKNTKYISEDFYDLVYKNKESYDKLIDYKRDSLISFFGLRTLLKGYLLSYGEVIERPQDLFLRVSVFIHRENFEKVKETYELMSNKYFIHATPSLFNAGSNKTQMSSCFLLTIKDDSAKGIFDTLTQCTHIAKMAGGIGVNISHIRARGSPLSTGGTSNGIIPMIKVFEAMSKFISQCGNKRASSIAFFLEPWHPEILEFLDLRKNTGKEEMRSRSIFTALWVPDLFMKKVEENEDWCLFCPNIAKGLSEVYGDEFDNLYEKYEKENKVWKRIPAQKLWRAIIEAQIETGTPYILYKDSCNKKNNQKNLGILKGSNLCAEILEFTSENEVAVCNLASIALPSFLVKRESNEALLRNEINEKLNLKNNSPFFYDFSKLMEVTKVVCRNLNKIIDYNFYPVVEAKSSNIKHRPIGIGVQGLADLFAMLKISFDSGEAKILNRNIFECIYYAALEESNLLAIEEGAYSSFEGSPLSKGEFQFDMWNVKPSNHLDWESLRNKIIKHGVRNSLLTACMPTATTSQILGFNECIEPFTSNIYTRRTLAGEYQVINKHLLKDLIERGLWNKEIKNLLIQNEGSIQNIPIIPKEIRDIYKTVWEYKMKSIIDLSVGRGPFIDQTQSLNIFMSSPTMQQLTSMHFYGWKNGLKTGMYYLRTQPKSSAIKFTVDKELLNQTVKSLSTCSLDDENCESCSA